MADITTPGTAEDRRREIQKEYGTYVAAEDIFINGVLAFATGYPVPISHTQLYPSLLEKNADGNAPVKRVEADAPAASEGESPGATAPASTTRSSRTPATTPATTPAPSA